jgi:hypothetical protein
MSNPDDVTAVTRRGLFGSALASIIAGGSAEAQGVADRVPSRHGYANILLTETDPLEAMERGVRSASVTRWHQRLILLAEDATPQQAVNILTNWAQNNALSNTHMSAQSSGRVSLHLDQAKLIAGAAMVYLRTKQAATPQQQVAIEGWLAARGMEVKNFFESVSDNHAINLRNHRTWGGLAAAAVGMAIGPRDTQGLAAWGMNSAQRTINRIQADGSIQNEANPHEVLNPLFALAHLSLSGGQPGLYRGDNAAKLDAAARWGIGQIQTMLDSRSLPNRPGQQRMGTDERQGNTRINDHFFPFAAIYANHAERRIPGLSAEGLNAARTLLRGFRNQAFSEQFIPTGRRGREEVPVLSHLGGAVSDILSIGQGRGR